MPRLGLEHRPVVGLARHRLEPDAAGVRSQLRAEDCPGHQGIFVPGLESGRPEKKDALAVRIVDRQGAARLVFGPVALHLGHLLPPALNQVLIRRPARAPAAPEVRELVGQASGSEHQYHPGLHRTTSARRCETRSAHSGAISLHAARLCKRIAAAGMLPLPAKGSRMSWPGRDHCRTRGSRTEKGLWFGWLPQPRASPSSSYPAATHHTRAASSGRGGGSGFAVKTRAVSYTRRSCSFPSCCEPCFAQTNSPASA